jgi:hypothetical protein
MLRADGFLPIAPSLPTCDNPRPETPDIRSRQKDHTAMGLNRAVLERQLERADALLADCVKKLTAAGVSKDDLKSTAAWRQSDAHRRQIRRRMISSDAWHSRGAATEGEDGEASEE